MPLKIVMMLVAAAGLSACVSTYATEPVHGANASGIAQPQAYSVMMFDHPDETAPAHIFADTPPVAGR